MGNFIQKEPPISDDEWSSKVQHLEDESNHMVKAFRDKEKDLAAFRLNKLNTQAREIFKVWKGTHKRKHDDVSPSPSNHSESDATESGKNHSPWYHDNDDGAAVLHAPRVNNKNKKQRGSSWSTAQQNGQGMVWQKGRKGVRMF